MQEELVRPGTMSPDLTLQVMLGSALEAVYMLAEGEPIDDADRDALRAASARLRVQEPLQREPGAQQVWQAESVDILTVAKQALTPTNMTALTDRLRSLSEALDELAEHGASDKDYASIIGELTLLRSVLRSRRSMDSDEVRGQLTSV